MKNTEAILNKIIEILNSNPVCLQQIEMMQKQATKNGLTKEQWEAVKASLLTSLFFKMCEMIPEFKEKLGEDIYNELKKPEK